MIHTIPYVSQDWAGGFAIPSEVTWTWALALLIPFILSGAAVVGSALRQLSIAKDANARAAGQRITLAGPPAVAPGFDGRAAPRRGTQANGPPPQHALP